LLSELDAFEGIGLEDDRNGEYHRVRKEVSLDDTPTEVWIYEWLKGIEDYEVVASGDWLASS
ncbi:MAG: gamma-glutamylcyclotransferase family protein, partial [Akkermansiaceae bacterium]